MLSFRFKWQLQCTALIINKYWIQTLMTFTTNHVQNSLSVLAGKGPLGLIAKSLAFCRMTAASFLDFICFSICSLFNFSTYWSVSVLQTDRYLSRFAVPPFPRWSDRLTLKALPYSSPPSMLSIACWASSGSSNSTNPNPRCCSVHRIIINNQITFNFGARILCQWSSPQNIQKQGTESMEFTQWMTTKLVLWSTGIEILMISPNGRNAACNVSDVTLDSNPPTYNVDCDCSRLMSRVSGFQVMLKWFQNPNIMNKCGTTNWQVISWNQSQWVLLV